jgi:ADP-heptose:LPS heptosyltransferase
MAAPLIPPSLLSQADKVLFLTHLSIGDFTYLKTYFEALARRFPRLTMDLWVDDGRRDRFPWPPRGDLGKYVLYDWLDSCGLFRQVYRVYSRPRFREALGQARAARYPLVVSLATSGRAPRFARAARVIAGRGMAVGLVRPTRWYQLPSRRAYRQLDAQVLFVPGQGCAGGHITDVFASWFERLFGVGVEPPERGPRLTVPPEWLADARARFSRFGVNWDRRSATPVVFVNPFAKMLRRSWQLSRAAELIRAFPQQSGGRKMKFLLNTFPERAEEVQRFLHRSGLTDAYPYTANVHFFQLPAAISLCDLVVTVDTSVAHLTSALGIPAVELMCRDNPEWRPWDTSRCVVVRTTSRLDAVKTITVPRVLEACALLRRYWEPDAAASPVGGST